MATSSDLSPYAAGVSAVFYSASVHFHAAAEVWEAFAAGSISSRRREELLSILRHRLANEVALAR
jgi:hypothetical protein